MKIRELTALELGAKIKAGEVSCRQAVEAYLDAIEKKDGAINAYITVMRDEALARADEVQAKIDAGEYADSPLAGVPVAIKDNMCTKDVLTSAASKILSNFKPPYDATVIEKLNAAGAIIIGKVNMDEFAMGGSTETSFYGATGNPWDVKRVPGGSSGGSAAAVAAGMAPYSLGSDTGGSIRQPAAFTGLTGIKPTYGAVSRYGLLAYASSLDQIGPVAHDVKDAAAILALISGHDSKDSTSIIEEAFDFTDSIVEASDFDADGKCSKIAGMKIGIPANYFGEGLDTEIAASIKEAAKALEAAGAIVEEFEMPIVDYAVPAYYIVACAEASSNLSRYDGIKYGHRTKNASDLVETYYKSRSEGFGAEVKRRIRLGSFVLSSGYFDAYYKKALQVRGLIKKAFDEAYEKYDMILSPVSPTVAYEIGGQIEDPIAMYMADIYTVSINLAGLPAVSVPCGFASNGMPIGMQFIGDSFREDKLVKMASAYQAITDYHKSRPAIFADEA
ncbi:MAG: Asp-tRNA(Asn)/Glu-tRNA(Gln) amidotransferase subunit GatA [Firmicutes bacterium]|nr:Asp-tRNA(Asn)/Glu-tRNA(Gln) amidotransferase subunit GatA [Bacillota bacterium]